MQARTERSRGGRGTLIRNAVLSANPAAMDRRSLYAGPAIVSSIGGPAGRKNVPTENRACALSLVVVKGPKHASWPPRRTTNATAVIGGGWGTAAAYSRS